MRRTGASARGQLDEGNHGCACGCGDGFGIDRIADITQFQYSNFMIFVHLRVLQFRPSQIVFDDNG